MSQLPTGIIKNRHVSYSATPGVVLTKPPVPKAGAAARIIKQADSHLVIEVTCPCGEKIHVQCDYAR